MATEADDRQRDLSDQQLIAIDLLLEGKNVTTVAKLVGVSRQTVSEWRNQNPAFKAVVNQRRQELWDILGDRLRAQAPVALDIIEKELKKGNFKAAVEVLKAVGLHGLHKPEGPTNPRDFQDRVSPQFTAEDIRAITRLDEREARVREAREREAKTAMAKGCQVGEIASVMATPNVRPREAGCCAQAARRERQARRSRQGSGARASGSLESARGASAAAWYPAIAAEVSRLACRPSWRL